MLSTEPPVHTVLSVPSARQAGCWGVDEGWHLLVIFSLTPQLKSHDLAQMCFSGFCCRFWSLSCGHCVSASTHKCASPGGHATLSQYRPSYTFALPVLYTSGP